MKFEWLLKMPIAHRGLHDADRPENSIPAFEAAIDKGYSIEIDVHLSKDGHIIVFHDSTLKRVCGVDKKIKDCSLAELKTYRLMGKEDCQIPTFDEFLTLVDGKVGILCEIKGMNPYANKVSREVCKRVAAYKGNIALQSFNYGSVRCCRRQGFHPVGQLCSWQSPKGQSRWFATSFMGTLWITKISKPDFIAYDIRDIDAENKYIINARKTHPVITWTVREPSQLETAKKYADNIIFESIESEVAQNYLPTK